ncbi:hypothetical protein D9M68_557740 [compost metagenome]
MHYGGAFTHIGAQAHAGGVGDAHTGRYHVVGHLRELVHRKDFQQLALQAGFQLALGQFAQVDCALAGPGHVRQQREDAGQVQAVGLGQAVGQEVQLEVGLGSGGQRGVFGQQGGDQRLVAFGQAGQQRGLGGVDVLQGGGQLSGLDVADGNGLVTGAVAENRGDGGHQLLGRLEQRLRVEDFQPVALAVLGADAEGDAEESVGHGDSSC